MFRSRIQTQYPARTTPRSKHQTETDKNSASDLRCATWRTISWKSWRSTLEGSMSVHREARAKVRSSDEEVPLTHGRGVCGSGNRSHSHPARVPARCGQARPLGTGPLRLLRTTPVTCGITIPSITGVIRIPLVLGAQRGNAGREAAGSRPCRQDPPVAGASDASRHSFTYNESLELTAPQHTAVKT